MSSDHFVRELSLNGPQSPRSWVNLKSEGIIIIRFNWTIIDPTRVLSLLDLMRRLLIQQESTRRFLHLKNTQTSATILGKKNPQ
jgi:hypothetical protein